MGKHISLRRVFFNYVLNRAHAGLFCDFWRLVAATPEFFYTRAQVRIRTHVISGMLLIVALLGIGLNLAVPSQSAAATNNTINFQARLQSSAGNIVNDGNYNVEFKLYSASSGGSALWTETYQNSASQGPQVINGYLSVSLGSITAFPTTINWDQDLYLTMNIGGTTSGAPSWDGEMNPRLKVTALPYAFRAGQLAKLTGSNTSVLDWATQTTANTILLPNEGGTLCIQSSANCGFLTSSSAIQNTTTTQTNASFNIQSSADTNITGVLKARASQTADLFQAQDSTGAALLRITSAGVLEGANGSGTNVAGGNLTVAGGQGTGTGNGGNIVFRVAKPAGSSGSSLNALSTVFSLSGSNGSALFQNSADSATGFQIQDAGAQTLFVADTNGKKVAIGPAAVPGNTVLTVGTNTTAASGGIIFGTDTSAELYRSAAGVLTMSGSLTVLGTASSPGAGTNSEHFGLSSTAAGSETTVIGKLAASAGCQSVVIGYQASSPQCSNVVVGYNALGTSTGGAAVALGANANALSVNSIAIGASATVSTFQNNSIAIGAGATTTTNNQLVIGGGSAAISSAFIGNGVTNSAPSSLTLQGTGGSGTNIAGASITIAGGIGTGTGVGGSLNFQVAKAGSSGSSANSLATVLSLSGTNGAALFQNSGDSATAFQVQKAGGTTLLGVDTNDTNGRIFSGVANSASAIGFKLDTPSYTTSGAKLLSVQNNGSEKFSVDKDGNVNIASGAVYRINGAQLASTNLGDTSNLAYLNGGASSGSPQLFSGFNVFRVNATDAFQIQRTNGTNTVFRADTTNGKIAINLGSSAPTYTLDVGGDVNISSGSAFRMNGTDINTAGTLSNVAYLNQANIFSTGAATGNSLRVTTSGNPGSGNSVLSAVNTNGSPTGNLLNLLAGSTPTSKFSVAADGSFISTGGWTLNSSGNAVATLNTAGNTSYGQVLFQEGGSTRGSVQYYGSNQNASGVTNSSLAVQNDNGPIIFRQNGVNTLSVSSSDGAATLTGIQPATVAGSGTTPGAALTVTGAKGGNTSGTTGQTGGAGAAIVLNAGNGGNSASGSTNGSGGNVMLSAGAAGIGGVGGSAGNVIVRNGGNSTTAFQVQNAAGTALLTADTTNNKVNVLGTLTVGTSTTDGTITMANSTNSNLSILQADAPGNSGNATYHIPSIDGATSDTFCLLTLGNCGASISVSGTTNYVARFTGTSSFGIGKLYDDASFVGINTTTDNGQLSILSRAAAEPGLFVKAAASATSPVAVFKGGATPGVGANLLELQNAGSSTALAFFDANGNLNAPFGTFTGGALLQSDLIVNTVATIKGSNSLVLGETGTATGSILFKGSTAASGTIKLIGPNNPTSGTFNLNIPVLTANDTICTNGLLATACPNYAPATGSNNYLGKNTNDTSTASFNGTLLALSNTNTATSSVLSLTGAGTNHTLSVINSSNPTSGQALLFVNNTNASASGNLLDLRNNGSSVFNVNAAGNTTNGGTLGVTGDFTVGSSKLTVQASNGNTVVAGTLGVTGTLSANGGLTVAANQALSMAAGTGTFVQNYQNGASAGSLSGNFNAHTINATNFNNGGNTVGLNGVTVALTGTATSGGMVCCKTQPSTALLLIRIFKRWEPLVPDRLLPASVLFRPIKT
jgi:hypothetical protein